MPAILVVLLVVVPIVELVIVLQVGSVLGVWWTIVLLLGASLLGAYLLRVEGARTWRQFRQALAEGRWPGDEIAQGALVIVGGTLLLTPGFLTDVLGFAFLAGPTRRLVAGFLHRRILPPGVGPATSRWNASRRRAAGRADPHRAPGDPHRGPRPGETVLEVEVIDIERERPPMLERPRDDAPDRGDDDGPGGRSGEGPGGRPSRDT